MVINPYIFKREPNIIFKGLGGIGITREMFLEDTRDINRRNIRAFVDDGTDLKLHINKQFVLDRFGSQRIGAETPVRLLIGQNITGIEDVTGLIYRIENNTLFNVSNLCDFNFQGLESIGNEGFRDVQRALTFSAPRLMLLEYENPLVYLGLDNGSNPINSEFTILEGDGYFSGSRINFTAPSPLVTGAVTNNQNPYITFFPFPNATNFHGAGFRNCVNLEGEIKMLNATGDINMRLTINGASKVTKFILPNATRFIDTNQPFRNAAMLDEIDMRLVIEWIGEDCNWTGVNLAGLTIRANEVLKTAGVGGTMHPWLLSAETGGATIIWYDANGLPVLDYFITTWETTTPDESITIPTTGGGYNYRVDWGDGIVTQGHTGNATHIYAVAGIYTVKISGTFPQIYFNNGGDRLKIKSIEQWGSGAWTSLQNSFFGCTNLVGNENDTPDLTVAKFFNYAFRGTKYNNPKINDWDMSGITHLFGIFWDTPFNQPLDKWDVSSVINFDRTFQNCVSFDQDLSSWDVGNATSMTNFLLGVTLSTANYDATLIAWAALPALQSGVDFHGGNSKYSPAAVAARNILINDHGWTIADGGPV